RFIGGSRGDHIASVPEGRQPANRHDSSERPSGTIPIRYVCPHRYIGGLLAICPSGTKKPTPERRGRGAGITSPKGHQHPVTRFARQPGCGGVLTPRLSEGHRVCWNSYRSPVIAPAKNSFPIEILEAVEYGTIRYIFGYPLSMRL
ncbi:MAG: hypothetical protein GY801_26535, partial [bacterium]|nr:hypothetical protein [bacterium]